MSVPIDFDKPRELKFDLRAVRDLEAALDGKPLAAIIHDITRLGVNALVLALWAGLKHEDKTLNPNLVTKMLEQYLRDKKKLRVLAKAVDEALDETGLFRNEDEELAEGNVTAERAAS